MAAIGLPAWALSSFALRPLRLSAINCSRRPRRDKKVVVPQTEAGKPRAPPFVGALRIGRSSEHFPEKWACSFPQKMRPRQGIQSAPHQDMESTQTERALVFLRDEFHSPH